LSFLKNFVKNQQSLNRIAKIGQRWFRARKAGYPDWGVLVKNSYGQWQAALKTAQGGPKVLIATSTGGRLPVNIMESLLSVALTWRRAEVHVLLCDKLLPACLECEINWYPRVAGFAKHGPVRDLCRDCFWPAQAMYQALGLQVQRYSELVSPEEKAMVAQLAETLSVAEIAAFTWDGLAIGEHALAGALRFFARGTLDGEPYSESILRRYFQASLLTTYALARLLEQIHYDCAVFHHGIYVPQGLVGEVARQKRVRVVNWNPAYRKKCFIFSHGDTYHHTLMNEPVEKWENLPMTKVMETELMEYLQSRWYGTNDWIWFHEKPQFDLTSIARETGVDFTKPCIGLLTNVVWDAQLHYPANAFPNIIDWMVKTITYFNKRPDLQLLIRVHPAEIRGTLPSRQRMVDEINQAFPELPPNIFVIPPESQVSTYAAMQQCNAVIIFGTKTGVELTSMGIPVIVAGEAWIRNKGLTLDASSVEEYFQLLDRLPLAGRLDDATLRRARLYAYHFFFQRMIPVKIMESAKGIVTYQPRLNELGDLSPGKDPGIDLICDGILLNKDFIYSPPGANH
jgi:hypothetical protein